ncbi:substance-K receptor-like isoform X3 [Ruditapes philippinarum]|uniref:substance-K receptor-like isoform X3 n=1 Tax=Ruditapes philippinarum TaxID=129788 RepID=UPI00295B2128|nr:substance-K receptor-like isoform X3 [Ruditapes philippinarum]
MNFKEERNYTEYYNISMQTFGTLNVTQFNTNVSIVTNGEHLGDNIGPLSYNSEIGLIVLFTLTTTFSIVGNGFVIIVFARGRRSRTDLRPFLINLAICDLIMAIFCMPFTFIYTMMNTWIFSEPMCPIVLFVQPLSVSGSVFTNMAIGIDRFMAVMFPLRSRLTKQRAKYVIVVVWICSTALSSVQFKVARASDSGRGVTQCTEHWESIDDRKIYTVFVFVITYLIPLLILAITYSIIGILLWKRISPGNRDHARDLQQLRSKRKVVKMLIIVVAMFGICWFPLHLFILLLDFRPELFKTVSMETLTTLFIIFHWLAMSNSFANPIIYGFTNESFRADLVTLFYMWFPCCVCLTRMLPRHSSGSTYETVVFRRQSLYKQSAKINGTFQTRTVHSQRGAKPYLNGNRSRLDYENLGELSKERRKLTNGCGQRVILAMDRDYIKLEPVNRSSSIALMSEQRSDES